MSELLDQGEFVTRYKLVCRKCGAEDVTIHYEAEHSYSEYSGDAATLSFGCQHCDNDLVLYP